MTEIDFAVSRPLTPRETQVLNHLVAGKSNKEIAAVLGISARTIEDHKAQLYRKWGVRNLAQLLSAFYGMRS